MYLAWDGLAACLAWSVLFAFRKLVVEPRTFGIDIDATPDANFWKAIVLIPLFWWTAHTLMGMYVNIRSRHRALEVRQVIRASAIGGVVLFFALLLDDVTRTHVDHYQTLALWVSVHAGLTLLGRWVLTSAVVRRVQSGEWAFATILVGTEEDNARFGADLKETPGQKGWNILAQMTENQLKSDLGKLGRWLDEHVLDRAVITTSVAKRESMLGWVAVLEGKGVELLVVPGALDYMAGTVRSTNLFGVPLVNLSKPGLGHGMKTVKRFVDVAVSVVALMILSPLFLWIAWRVKRNSEGPVFYTQERLGLHGSPFDIVKFRTMFVNSEGGTPQLSSDRDIRITSVGKMLRQTRVDELPQFWNVLKGDMSLVGPRPERAFLRSKLSSTVHTFCGFSRFDQASRHGVK